MALMLVRCVKKKERVKKQMLPAELTRNLLGVCSLQLGLAFGQAGERGTHQGHTRSTHCAHCVVCDCGEAYLFSGSSRVCFDLRMRAG